jgi:hypothetical protein
LSLEFGAGKENIWLKFVLTFTCNTQSSKNFKKLGFLLHKFAECYKDLGLNLSLSLSNRGLKFDCYIVFCTWNSKSRIRVFWVGTSRYPNFAKPLGLVQKRKLKSILWRTPCQKLGSF